MPKMINEQKCGHVRLCAKTRRHTHKPKYAHLYKSWLCQNLLVVSCRRDARSCSQWQWWRKWAKITRAIPETFQSKDIPACSTLQQFNTVFTSDVVIVLSFSLSPVILNDRVEERITWENVFSLPVSLCVCLDVHVCIRCNVQFIHLCMSVCSAKD